MSIVVLIILSAATVTIKDIYEHKRNHQLALDLLGMRDEWASNDYHAQPLPRSLAKKGEARGWSAGILGAYVEYSYRQDGVDGTRTFHIYRPNTNSTTWTLYDIFTPADTNLSQMAHSRTLTIVTGRS